MKEATRSLTQRLCNVHSVGLAIEHVFGDLFNVVDFAVLYGTRKRFSSEMDVLEPSSGNEALGAGHSHPRLCWTR